MNLEGRVHAETYVAVAGAIAGYAAQQTLLGPTMPFYEVYNPAMAQVNAEHVFMVAEFDVMNGGTAPEAAIDKAFKRVEEIVAKYPITQA